MSGAGLPEITGRASCQDWAAFGARAQAAALDGWGWVLVAVVLVAVAAGVAVVLWRIGAADRAARDRHAEALAAIREAGAWAGYYRDLAGALLRRPEGAE